MLLLELEKPSTWSIGKIIGILAIILMFTAPFLPYYIYDRLDEDEVIESHGHSYIDLEFFSLLRFLPMIFAILIVILLYVDLEIYFKKDTGFIKINHFILMIGGFLFFIIYLQQIIEYSYRDPYRDIYPGYGLWMLVLGSFLCIIVGFLEWRYPSKSGFVFLKERFEKKEIPIPLEKVDVEPVPKTPASVETEKVLLKPIVKTDAPKTEQTIEPRAVAVTPSSKQKKIEEVTREPKNEEEKTLLGWVKHLNENNQAFERCMKCEKYSFLLAKEMDDSIIFECPNCGESFNLKKGGID